MPRTSALEVATTVCVLVGLVALAALGDAVAVAAVVAALLAVVAIPARGRLPSATPWGAITVVAAGAGVGVPLLLGTGIVEALSISLAAMQVLRRFARTGAGDDRTSVLLSLLMLVLGSTASTSPWLGAAAIVWAATAPLVAILAYLQSAAPRSSADRPIVGSHLRWLSGLSLLLALLAFLALPRLRPAALGAGSSDDAHVGFNDSVALGELGDLLDDPTPALRMTLPPGQPAPTYVRGLVLDRFDGRTWTATVPDLEQPLPRPEGAVPVQVVQEPGAGPVAFAPGLIVDVDADPPGFQADQAGNQRLLGPARRHTYTAWVVPIDADPSPPEHRWVLLPDTLDPRIQALANEIAGDTVDPMVATARIEAWLDENTSYTFSPRDAQAEAPLSTFLFDTRAGHCEYFAAATAVLLRSAGHPARVVNGYAQPEWNGVAGHWLVRSGNAHSWVEVQARDGRWHRVDPTPSGSRPPPPLSTLQRLADAATTTWYDGVLAYDGSVQVGMVRSAGWWVQTRVTGAAPQEATPWLGLLLLLGPAVALTLAAILVVRRVGRRLAGERPRRPTGRVARLHARARATVARAGWRVPESLPPVDAARWLAHEEPESGAELEALAWLHYRVRYGGEDDADLAAEARARLTSLTRTLPRRAPGPR